MSIPTPAPAGRTPLDEARDIHTSPERLRSLASVGGEVANALAANPNTPTKTLLWLAQTCWEAFLRNPVLPLLLLENPGLPLQLPKPALLALLRLHEPPPEFLHALQRHADPEVRDAARLHRRAAGRVSGDPLLARLEAVRGSGLALRELMSVDLAPPWLLRWAMESGSKALRKLAWERAKQSGDEAIREHQVRLQWFEWLGTRKPKKKHERFVTTERLVAFSEGGVFARQLAAKNRATPPDILQRLAIDPAQPAVVRTFAAKNPGTPATALLSLAMGGDKSLRAAVLRNPSTPAGALDQLAAAPEVDFRRRVAGNRNTPPGTLARLAQDADEEVRTKVALNPATDLTTLKALAADPSEGVRRGVAQRAGCPFEVLAQLCRDQSAHVRMRVVDNASFPNREHNERKLHWLLRNHKGAWNEAAALPSVLDFPDSEIPPEMLRPYVAQRDAAPEALAAQATHPEQQLRADAAGREQTPPESLLVLAQDANAGVRRQAALNAKLPVAAHASLANDADASVRRCLASRQPLAPELFDLLLHDADPTVQEAALCNSRLPAERKDAELRARYTPEFAKKIEASLASFPDSTLLWLLDQQPKLAEAFSLRNHPSAAVMNKIIDLLESWPRQFFIHCKGSDLRQREAEPLTDEQMLRLAEPNGKHPEYERETLARKLVEYPAVTPHVLETLARRQMLAEPPRGRRYLRSSAQRGGSLAMIAAHPRTPPALLAELAQYWNRRARLAALTNPMTPPEAKAARAQHVIGEAARSSSLMGRLCALTHESAPLTLLRRAAFDGTWAERYSVAQNPRCPRDLLALLREDANIAVRDAARAQWQARFAADDS